MCRCFICIHADSDDGKPQLATWSDPSRLCPPRLSLLDGCRLIYPPTAYGHQTLCFENQDTQSSSDWRKGCVGDTWWNGSLGCCIWKSSLCKTSSRVSITSKKGKSGSRFFIIIIYYILLLKKILTIWCFFLSFFRHVVPSNALSRNEIVAFLSKFCLASSWCALFPLVENESSPSRLLDSPTPSPHFLLYVLLLFYFIIFL